MSEAFWFAFGWYVAGLVTPFALVVLIGILFPHKWMMH